MGLLGSTKTNGSTSAIYGERPSLGSNSLKFPSEHFLLNMLDATPDRITSRKGSLMFDSLKANSGY